MGRSSRGQIVGTERAEIFITSLIFFIRVSVKHVGVLLILTEWNMYCWIPFAIRTSFTENVIYVETESFSIPKC
jgi:hypothetical protein